MIENLTAPVLTGYEAAAEDDGFVTVVPDVSVRPVVEETLEQRLLRLATEIHADNVAAGWWTDLHTGESILATRNRPEIMMLIVSELSEASEGFREGANDDKLPDLPMFDVELADAAIRLLDVLGADGATTKSFEDCQHSWADYLRFKDADVSLMMIVNHVSAAMEHYRKGRTVQYVEWLAGALLITIELAEAYNIDLFDIIEAKRAYNRQRADHKPENRRAAGGKAF